MAIHGSDAPGVSLEEQIAVVQQLVDMPPGNVVQMVSGEMPDAILASLQRLRRAEAIAREQAEDDGLWFRAETAPEAYLQRALRTLHAAIEGEPIEWKKP